MSAKRRLVQVTISTLDGEDLARTVIGLPGDGFYAALDELQEAVRAGDADSVLVKREAVFALKALEVATAGANVLARAAKTVGNFTVMGFHGKYSDGYAAALEDVSRYLQEAIAECAQEAMELHELCRADRCQYAKECATPEYTCHEHCVYLEG